MRHRHWSVVFKLAFIRACGTLRLRPVRVHRLGIGNSSLSVIGGDLAATRRPARVVGFPTRAGSSCLNSSAVNNLRAVEVKP